MVFLRYEPTPELKVELYLKYAHSKFRDQKYDEADAILSQYNTITIDNGLPVNHKIYYWKGRIEEAKGNFENN